MPAHVEKTAFIVGERGDGRAAEGLVTSGVDRRRLPENAADILAEVSSVAAAPGRPAERADALLAQMHRVVPFEGGLIALLPPDQHVHVPLSRQGFDDRTNRYYDSPGFLVDVELAGLQRTAVARRLMDLSVPPAEIPLWGEYLLPAGFREGLGVGLFTPDGRYMGLLGVATERPTPSPPEAINLVGLMAAQIAVAVDPLASLSTIAHMVHGAVAGVVLTAGGTVLALPGLPDHPLLASGSGVLAAAVAQLADGALYTSFLAPYRAADGTDTHVRVTGLAVPPDVRFFATTIVLLSPAGDLHGLSGRELQVLGLLVAGASNERIAAVLGISVRTVAAHVEHLRAKMRAASRTVAAGRALRLGLFVPCSLLTDRRGRTSASSGRGTGHG